MTQAQHTQQETAGFMTLWALVLAAVLVAGFAIGTGVSGLTSAPSGATVIERGQQVQLGSQDDYGTRHAPLVVELGPQDDYGTRLISGKNSHGQSLNNEAEGHRPHIR